jgi:hypothetical protein
MTRAEWDEVEKVLNRPDVQLVMRGRCEEQGHQFDNGADLIWRSGAVTESLLTKTGVH